MSILQTCLHLYNIYSQRLPYYGESGPLKFDNLTTNETSLTFYIIRRIWKSHTRLYYTVHTYCALVSFVLLARSHDYGYPVVLYIIRTGRACLTVNLDRRTRI